MQFNDTATRQGLIQDCEDNLNLGATAISGNTTLLQQFTRYMNNHYQKVVTMILESMDDWDFDDANKSDYPVATTPFIASQRDYTFPASLKILKIKRVDITYDGTNYVQANQFDSGSFDQPLGNTTAEDANFSTAAPAYDIKANSLWVYPMATAAQIAAGAKIRVEFFREPTEFTTASTTTEPGFDEPFHRMLSIGASLDYALIRTLPAKNDLAVMYADYEKRLKLYYGKKNQDTRMQLSPKYENYA